MIAGTGSSATAAAAPLASQGQGRRKRVQELGGGTAGKLRVPHPNGLVVLTSSGFKVGNYKSNDSLQATCFHHGPTTGDHEC